MRHRRPFGCGMPTQTVVHPTKYNQVNTCTESEVKHIHPSHTNCVNHHLVKNTHYFPHTTSYQNTVDQVNVYGGPMQGPGQFGGFSQPGPGQWNPQNNMPR
ncbi:CotD family spore coat protein [Gracilibacillus kekensis]|uniref:Spore coat protein D n=1 Tax=Gracilibacillus kekensis TaxID=1027249 RepID=A0A1M7PP91_9BACI|nr:CotD family spore coat protein [Gracilibacillus kekensis]SHN19104.1 spore coat protein D [Gracilibacillus kekensis]